MQGVCDEMGDYDNSGSQRNPGDARRTKVKRLGFKLQGFKDLGFKG